MNPAIPRCFYCGKEKNEIILAGRLKDDQEAPRGAVWDLVPCDACRGLMDRGVILISTRDDESGDDPYRTGGWIVVADDFIRRVVTAADVRDTILTRRFAFVPDAVWTALSLPRAS